MKGQLFMVAIVFLIGMVFVVQQALFTYSSIDVSQPFNARGGGLFRDMVGIVNQTIKDTYYCNETRDSFQDRLDDIKTLFLAEHGREYSIEFTYSLNCSAWSNAQPSPSPLRITISVTSRGSDTRGTFDFYHKQ